MTGRLVRDANRWRSAYNPLRGLTMQRAVSLLEAGEQGRYCDLMWTYRFIEKREPTLRALKRLRIGSIRKLDWDIKTVPARRRTPAWERAIRNFFGNRPPDQIADEQADALRLAYERIENLREGVSFLALAEFRAFAHLEKIYQDDDPAAGVVRLEPVEQWHWLRDGLYSPWQYDATATGARGAEINREHFIIREVEDPINEIGFICYLRKNLSQKDWDGFVETYGIPPLFGELPPDVDEDDVDEFQSMLEAVVADMRGTIPNGAKVHTVDAGARGTNPFRDHVDYQDEQLVLAGTSGKLTMLTDATGLGSGASDAHTRTFDDLAQAEPAEISEIFQRQFDRAVLDAAGFRGQPALAYFELAAQDKTDIGAVLDHAVKAKTAGFQADAAEISEKTGYKLTVTPAAAPAFGAPSPSPFGAAFNRASAVTPPNDELRRAALEKIARALDARLKPIREKLQAALDEKDDAAFDAAVAELPKLKAEFPALLKKAGADDALVRAFMESYGTALIDGAATAAQTRNRGGFVSWLRTLFRP